MILKQLKPRKALNKAYLKLKPDREKIDIFKANLIKLLDTINDSESEEYHKNLISDFLKDTYYKDDHFINTKERADLVIHNGKNRASTVGVIIETKRPSNRWEMITPGELNAKAMHELLLYYLRERITNGNLEVRNLIVTNIHEWFIFDSAVFERNFAQNKALIRQFEAFEKSKQRTEVFYTEIAHPFIESLKNEIEFAYFDIRDYNHPLRNDNPDDDNKLIALYKLLSAEHLLKLPFANDSNTLDKSFYGELLHIMGLSESKEGGKKVIGRDTEGKRNTGSLIENAINELDSLDKMSRLDNPSQYGDTMQERLFSVALELSITWMNRILFMKLLEAQLIKYHKGDRQYEFLNIDKIQNYDDLNSLFFKVLARKLSDRGVTTKEAFERVPYLNSSLFEPTELEHTTLFVSNLGDSRQLPIYSATVLKDDNGKRRTGKMNPLEYLFEFLDSYDFTSEGSEAIQEDNKTLINASVLGLIFEKINGYKDGSFFTPGFITMYMCRETIRKAVLQKFNETKQWNCQDMTQLYNKINDIDEANQIVNSLKICDPAVGSGHFLVSALNEIIAIKNDLSILVDRKGRRLRGYHVVVENDELIVTDEEGAIFEYNPTSHESQRVQEALFHEKQTIIESCLFGVDINPNSVKICRLRLWIELLKNAYYKNETELETLPNIDINIKCGNSLVSRFALDANLGQALKKSKWTIDSYRVAVATYRNAHNKEEKRAMERLMVSIKNDFRSEIAGNDPKVKRLAKIKGELLFLTTQTSLFEQSRKEKKEWNDKVDKLSKEIKKLETEIGEIKANKIYENAFEWRFEFPEVLNDEGDFVGFDVVIGNPPYIRVQELSYEEIDYYKENFKVALKRVDISILFIELSRNILKEDYYSVFITSNQFLTTEYGETARSFLLSDYSISKIVDFGDAPVFEEAQTYVSIFIFNKSKAKDFLYSPVKKESLLKFQDELNFYVIEISNLDNKSWVLKNKEETNLINKLDQFNKLISIGNCWAGLFTGMDKVLMCDSENGYKFDIEPDLLLPVLRAQDCEKYKCSPASKLVIYPYKVKDGKTTLLKEKELQAKYPKAFDYLSENKQQLSKRKDSRKNIDKDGSWYKLTRFGRKEIFEMSKIISPGEVKNHKFCIDDSSAGFSCARVIAITVHDDRINLNQLVAILNSQLIKYYLQSKASLKAGGYYSYSSKVLNDAPIPNIERLNSSDLEAKSVKIQSLKKSEIQHDTTALESEIDQLVYELYGLTEEEIGIVEGS